MKPSSSVSGALRLPLVSKKGNKDFYKGNRQAYVPGGGHRTGPPGRFVIGGKAKFRLLDTMVRYYVGPGPEVLATTELRPYVSTNNQRVNAPDLPLFAPNVNPDARATRSGFTKFSRQYQKLTYADKEALKIEARRTWWNGMVARYGDRNALAEADDPATRELEERAAAQNASRP